MKRQSHPFGTTTGPLEGEPCLHPGCLCSIPVFDDSTFRPGKSVLLRRFNRTICMGVAWIIKGRSSTITFCSILFVLFAYIFLLYTPYCNIWLLSLQRYRPLGLWESMDMGQATGVGETRAGHSASHGGRSYGRLYSGHSLILFGFGFGSCTRGKQEVFRRSF